MTDYSHLPVVAPGAVNPADLPIVGGESVSPELSRLSNTDNWRDLAASVLRGGSNLADAVISYSPSNILTPNPNRASVASGTKLLLEALTGNADAINYGRATPIGAVGEAIPASLASPGSAALNLTGALGAGVGRKYGGAKGEFIGSLTPAGLSLLTGALSKLVGPQTAGGAERAVGELAQKYGVTPERVDQAIIESTGDPLAASKTSAEILQSPELATLEQSMGGAGPKSTEYAKAALSRKEAADKLIDSLSQAEGLPREFTGDIVQSSIGEAKNEIRKAANKNYLDIPKNVTPDTTKLKAAIQEAGGKYFGEGSPDVPRQIAGRAKYLEGKAPTLEGLQNARSHLMEYAEKSAKFGDNRAAAMAHEIGDSIAKTIENAPTGSQEWIKANNAWREFAENYIEGPLGKITEAKTSTVINKILASPEAAKQAKKIAPEKAIEAIKDQIASDFRGMTDAAKVRFVDKNKSQLKELLGDNYKVLDAIRNDIRSRIDTATLANPTRGPNTALKLSDVVQRALTGKGAPKNGVWELLAKAAGVGGVFQAARFHPTIAIPAVVAGAGVSALRGRSADLVQSALYDALMNPQKMQSAVTAAAVPQGSRITDALTKAVLPAAEHYESTK